MAEKDRTGEGEAEQRPKVKVTDRRHVRVEAAPPAGAEEEELAFAREQAADYRDHLRDVNATIVRADRDIAETWDRARLMFDMRRTVIVDGATVVVFARQRPLLEYYANSIRHLLPYAALPDGQLLSPATDTFAIPEKYRLQEVGKSVSR